MCRSPHGGRRVECANCEKRGVAPTEWKFARVSEQLSRVVGQQCVEQSIALSRRRGCRNARVACVGHRT
eukprot:9334154-Lingulodinium_polyedra.AAC.1